MANLQLRSLISEMMVSYLEESASADQYHRMIHTGEPPKPRKNANSSTAKPAKPVKSYNDLHTEIKSTPNAERLSKPRYGVGHHSYYLDRNKTSATRAQNVLKKSGWKEDSSNKYKHPDGHTAEYDEFNHTIHLYKKK